MTQARTQGLPGSHSASPCPKSLMEPENPNNTHRRICRGQPWGRQRLGAATGLDGPELGLQSVPNIDLFLRPFQVSPQLSHPDGLDPPGSPPKPNDVLMGHVVPSLWSFFPDSCRTCLYPQWSPLGLGGC